MDRKRVRPPWNQELTPYEAERMLEAARKVGGEVLKWAIHTYYIQSALAMEVWIIENKLHRIKTRYANARRVRRELRNEIKQVRSALNRIVLLDPKGKYWKGAVDIANAGLEGTDFTDSNENLLR
jgi:hypothetical protein